MTPAEPYRSGVDHLRGELLVLNLRLHRELLRWRACHHDQATPDELLGLYISDRDVDVLLDALYATAAEPDADAAARAPLATLDALIADAAGRHRSREHAGRAAGVELPLPTVSERLGLDGFERGALLLALAPELDRRYERVFAYLSDDATVRRPTVALALDLLCGGLEERLWRRRAFNPRAPLRRLRVLRLGDEPGTLLSRALSVEARVAADILGGEAAEPLLERVATRVSGSPEPPPLEQVEAGLARIRQRFAPGEGPPEPLPPVVISGPDAELAERVAAHLAAAAGRDALVSLDGEALLREREPEEVVACACREALLGRAALALRASEEVARDPSAARALDLLVEAGECGPRFLIASAAWVPEAAPEVLTLALPELNLAERARLWREALDGAVDERDVGEVADRFRLTSGQVRAAAGRARARARARGPGVLPTREDLHASCRERSAGALGALAPRTVSIHDWDDLVLPPDRQRSCASIEHSVRYRARVYEEWGFAQRVPLGRGLSVLFAGPSGTGKTMAAEVIAARARARPLPRRPVAASSASTSARPRRTSSRIFDAAERLGAVLFFDEADALFGKRSEVKRRPRPLREHRGRATCCSGWRSYDGVVDPRHQPARRTSTTRSCAGCTSSVEFPLPGGRRARADLARAARRAAPLATTSTSRSSRAGSSSPAATSATRAHGGLPGRGRGRAIGMRHLAPAIARELAKLDQPVVRGDFGEWYDAIRGEERMEEAVR